MPKNSLPQHHKSAQNCQKLIVPIVCAACKQQCIINKIRYSAHYTLLLSFQYQGITVSQDKKFKWNTTNSTKPFIVYIYNVNTKFYVKPSAGIHVRYHIPQNLIRIWFIISDIHFYVFLVNIFNTYLFCQWVSALNIIFIVLFSCRGFKIEDFINGLQLVMLSFGYATHIFTLLLHEFKLN